MQMHIWTWYIFSPKQSCHTKIDGKINLLRKNFMAKQIFKPHSRLKLFNAERIFFSLQVWVIFTHFTPLLYSAHQRGHKPSTIVGCKCYIAECHIRLQAQCIRQIHFDSLPVIWLSVDTNKHKITWKHVLHLKIRSQIYEMFSHWKHFDFRFSVVYFISWKY